MGITELKKKDMIERVIELHQKGFSDTEICRIMIDGLRECTNTNGEYCSERTIISIVNRVMDDAEKIIYLRGLY